MKSIGISILFVFFAAVVYSQKKTPENLPLIKSEEDGNMYYLDKEQIVELALKNVKTFFKLTPEDELVLYKTNPDEAGNSHMKYQHYHSGVPVYGSQIILHSKENLIYAVNGELFGNITAGSNPVLSADEAGNRAVISVGADAHLISPQTRSDEEGSTVPLLEYYKVDDQFLLAYKVTVESTKPYNKYAVRISASDGALVNKHSILIDCMGNKGDGHDHAAEEPVKPQAVEDTKAACSGDCNNGQGTMLYYTDQYLVVGKHQFGLDCKYRLLNGCYNTVIHTMSKSYISNNAQSGSDYEYTDQTTYFNFAVLAPGNTAHWGITMADEFYRGYFGRDGFSGGGGTLNAYCNSNGAGTDNAYYDPSSDQLNFGTGGGSLAHNDIVSLDIVGHEFTHGVSQYEANFDAYGEPGALNESFSDIMGTMIEDYAKSIHGTGTSFSYDYGNEPYYHVTYVVPGGGPTIYTDRDMSYPNNSNLPDTYNGTNFWNPASTSVDYGGRHINCTIQDYWFYLLAEGGSGTNDLGNPFCIQGIGKNSAMRIVYQNLCNYMSTYSNFASARSGSIQAAIDLFGANSNEVAQVTAAWYAVGVGAQYSGQINLYNMTINSNYTRSYNAGIAMQNVTVNNPAQLTVTSNNYILLLPDVAFNPGSVASLYIAPGCNGGARPANEGDHLAGFATAQVKAALSTDEETTDAFSIYPNPTDGIVTIEHPEGSKEVLVYNLVGKLILKTEIGEGTSTRIDLNEQPSGTYLIKVDGSLMKRLVKQ